MLAQIRSAPPITATATEIKPATTSVQSQLNFDPTNIDIEFNSNSNHTDSEASFSSSDDDSSNLHNETQEVKIVKKSVIEELATWSITHNITHLALKDLLALCKNWMPSLNFPKDPRTLLHTQRKIILQSITGGTFYHFGVESNLIQILELHTLNQNENLIKITLGVDGVPISKSSNLQFWPILGKIENLEQVKVFIISLFYGSQKPQCLDEFLGPCVEELLKLKTSGLTINGITFSVIVGKIIADAPARSFLKRIKNHNAYFGCERCYVRGEWHGRVIFPVNNDNLFYNDDSFKNRIYEDHHSSNDTSPLERLGVGMISQIPIDYMHLCCLGIMKKLILVWINGPLPHRLSNNQIKRISDKLVSFKKRVPSHFSRKPRSLSEVRHWKATEFRTFILYTGPMSLKGSLSTEKYHHFIKFHCGMYILISELAKSKLWVDFAENLFKEFVADIPKLYYKEMLVYNVHTLTHLASDVRVHGPLDSFSAFSFENFMQTIKRMLRTNSFHLSQVVSRISEINSVMSLKENDLQKLSRKLSSKLGDNCFITVSGQICILELANNKIMCRYFLNKEEPKSYPLKSSALSIFYVKKLGILQDIDFSILEKKCILLPVGKKYFCVPLCNSYNL